MFRNILLSLKVQTRTRENNIHVNQVENYSLSITGISLNHLTALHALD